MKEEFDIIGIKNLLPAFIEKMFGGEVAARRWDEQRLYAGKEKVEFRPIDKKLTHYFLLRHFRQKPERASEYGTKYLAASLAVKPTFMSKMTGKYERCRWLCIDVDNDRAMKAVSEKLLPFLQKKKIEYIYEYAGTEEDRAHIWIFCNTDLSILRKFVTLLSVKCGIGDASEWLKLQLELFPVTKPENVIRLLGGYHIRARKANPILFRGVKSADAKFVIRAVIACKPISEGSMVRYITKNLTKEELASGETTTDTKNILGSIAESSPYSRSIPSSKSQEGFVYQPSLRLKDPFDERGYAEPPPLVRSMVKGCQAINTLFNRAFQGGLNNIGEVEHDVHKMGVFLGGMFEMHDVLIKRDTTREGRNFYEKFIDRHRLSEYYSHQWLRGVGDDKIMKAVPNCDVWQNNFDLCKGCPHKGRDDFHNPRQLHFNAKIIKGKRGEVIPLGTNEEIAEDVLKRMKDLVNEALNSYGHMDIAVGSAQGSMKSTNSDTLAAWLSSVRRKKTLIVTANGEQAMEHKERIDLYLKGKSKSFVLMSFKNLFKHLKPGFTCPNKDEITELVKIGSSKAAIANRYCSGCKYESKCPYPWQYKEMMDEKYDVVIAQHAHFAAKEALGCILKKQFDVMIIDENFLGSIRQYIRPTRAELEYYKTKYNQIGWLKDIYKWLRDGKRPEKKRLFADEVARAELCQEMEAHGLPWNMPDYIKAYESGLTFHRTRGLFRFFPPPSNRQIPIRICLDATLPYKLVKMVMNSDDLKLIGKEKLLDVRQYNPGNRIIKVIDSTTSRSSLSNAECLGRLLNLVAYKMRTEYAGLTGLVTVFKSAVPQVKAFFDEYHPEESKRITVAHMAVGSNKYAHINIQFLLSGVHFNGRDLSRSKWELTQIENHFRDIEGKELIPNPYPDFSSKAPMFTPSSEMQWVPVQLKLINKGGKCYRMMYDGPGVQVPRPIDLKLQMVDALPRASSQQAMRLRFFDKNLKVVYDFSNRYFPGLAYTDVKLLGELLKDVNADPEMVRIVDKIKKKQGTNSLIVRPKIVSKGYTGPL